MVGLAAGGYTNVASIPLGDIGESSDVEMDAAGNHYVAGFTSGANISGPVFRYGPAGFGDAVIRKFDPNGNILFTVLIGGIGSGGISDVAVDGDGNIYAVGTTYSSNFPTQGAIQSSSKHPPTLMTGRR